MSRFRKGMALLLCAALCTSGVPVSAAAQKEAARTAASIASSEDTTQATGVESQTRKEQPVSFNTGSYEYIAVDEAKLEALYEGFLEQYGTAGEDPAASAAVQAERELKHYVSYDADGNYTIRTEMDAFFPYEVQFTYDGKTESKWFLTRDDTVEVGGHVFFLDAPTSGEAVTGMNLSIGQESVVVYPEKKTFINDENSLEQTTSLLPLEEKELTVDVSGYSPIELTKVSFDQIVTGENSLPGNVSVLWKPAASVYDYQIKGSADGEFDLSYRTDSTDAVWEVIIGEKDQLAADNTRYIIHLRKAYTGASEWLEAAVSRDDQGVREQISFTNSNQYSYYDASFPEGRFYTIDFGGPAQGDYYLGLRAPKLSDKHVKVFEGNCEEGNETAPDVTESILHADLSAPGSGYRIVFNEGSSKRQWFTFASYDDQGKVTGWLPVEFRIYRNSYEGLSVYPLRREEADYSDIVYNSGNYFYADENIQELTYYLYKEYPANGRYKQSMNILKNGEIVSGSADLAAYAGIYASAAEAKNAGAEEITDRLFGNGYVADYSNGVAVSIFVGPDGPQQKRYRYRIRTETTEYSIYDRAPSSYAGVTIQGVAMVRGLESVPVPGYVIDGRHDSYGDNNYYLILIDSEVDGAAVDLKNLALVFETDKGVKLYAQGTSAAEESGKNPHDFSGLVQFRSSSEDGSNAHNYFIQVAKQEEGKRLWMNSLNDEISHTNTENGVTRSTREVVLDRYHNMRHDILVANVGTQTMSALKVDLRSDYLELDEYWTLSGNHDLSGFTTIRQLQPHGELANLAKVRLKEKEGIQPGIYEDLGTLTFLENGEERLVLSLTGVIGDPCITTQEIRNPTKYVPYGTMIMNSNKYNWNKVTYQLVGGRLPDGMQLMQNGELYGIAKEAGEFEITVAMKNSYRFFLDDKKTFRFTVLDNTDSNVDGAEDTGYKLTKRILGIEDTTASGDYLIISEGVFDEYTDLYIDGEKLVRGTDYEAESGSTQITIASKSLKKSEGTHTIGVEFQRNKNKGSVRAAAQNYTVKASGSSNSRPGSGSSGSSSAGGWSGGSSSGTSTKPASPQEPAPVTPVTPTPVSPPVVTPTADPKPVEDQDTSKGKDTTLSKDMIYARNYTVKSGDTLKSLAKKYYGKSSKWKKIYNANKEKIPASKKLKKGMKLQIPAINYTVKKGDTIKDIAKKYFGARSKWKLIYQVNKDVIPSSLRLKTGEKLVTPVPVVCMIYTVNSGDTLQKIAQKFYGKSSKWEKIYNANKNKATASGKVKKGTSLFIPALNCTVKKGEDLKSLAKAYYGAKSEWRRIYEANKDIIPDSKKLKAGMSLVIPVPADVTAKTG